MTSDLLRRIQSEYSSKDALDVHRVLQSISSLDRAHDLQSAILDLAEGRLHWVRQYAVLARKRPAEVLGARHTQLTEKEAPKYILPGTNTPIEWIPFDPVSEPVKPLDKEVEPLTAFLNKLEVCCLAECCGLQAFSFFQEDIEQAVKSCGTRDVRRKIQELIKSVNHIDENIVSCGQMNQLFHRHVFLQLYSILKSVFPISISK